MKRLTGASVPKRRDSSPEERLLKTARRLFMEYGVASVTTEMLAKEAEVSKSSIYKYFGGVQELFAAIIDENSRVFVTAPDLEFSSPGEFRAHLVRFGHNLSKLLSRDDVRKMTFAVMTHSTRDRATAELFFNRAIEAARLNLTRLLDAGRARGFLKTKVSTRRLATYLLSIWDGVDSYQYMMGLKARRVMAKAQVSETVEFVLGEASED